MNDSDTTDEDKDGTWPDGTPVRTPFPLTDEEIAGPRSGWPWVTATIVSQCGPDEWELVIEDEEATTDDDGTPCYPLVFRDASEIRLSGEGAPGLKLCTDVRSFGPGVEELRRVFFEEHGGAL